MASVQKPSVVASRVWGACQSKAARSADRFALFEGDAAEKLRTLPASCVHTCLTSPPYWGARDYEHAGQIGLEEQLDEYVSRLVDVFREVRRVLTPEGTVWLNLGDVYYHGAGTVGGRPPENGWERNKQLTLVPFRVALALQEDGWWLRNAIVWNKPNAMPASVRDRLTNTWEPVFLLAKSEKYFFDLDAIRVPHRTDDAVERIRAERNVRNGKASGKVDLRRWLNSPRHRSTIEGLREVRRRPNAPTAVELASFLRSALERKGVTLQWIARKLDQPFERVRHYFRTDSIGSRLPPEGTWERLRELLDLPTDYDDAMQVEVGDNAFRNHPNGRNPGDLISLPVASTSVGHFATMPPALASWTLRATLPHGGICLDPFMGSGTTGAVAIAQGGRFIGIDIQRGYLDYFADHLSVLKARALATQEKMAQLTLPT